MKGPGHGRAGTPPPETPDHHGAFPRLTDEQLAALAEYGERHQTEVGETLYQEGDPTCDFFAVVGGKVAIVTGYGAEERIIDVHGPGRFLGELSLLSGQAVFATAVVVEPGEVLRIPVSRLRELVARDQALGDLILRAYLIRRSILVGLGAGFRIIGSRYSTETRRLREFAARNGIPHRFVDLERDEGAEALLRELGITPQETPVVIWRGRQIFRNPSLRDVARMVGLHGPRPPDHTVDLVVVGAGPAGLAAAVYGASDGLTVLMLDTVGPGGQAGTSPRIDNYLGFPLGITGSELAARAAIQAERFGAGITVPTEASELEQVDGHHAVRLTDGNVVMAWTVLVATGARYRKLDVPRLQEFERTSVYYAATQIEAQLCRRDPVAVVGGGNSAGQAALFLAQHASCVRLLVRGDDLARSMSRYLADRIERTRGIEILLCTEVRELIGTDTLEALVVEDVRTGGLHRIECRALFVFIGAVPHAGWLRDQVALDDHGFVLTGRDAAPASAHGEKPPGARPAFLETSRRGVFAAGDVRSGSVKRVAAAVGEGSMAVRLVHDYLASLGAPLSP